MRTQYRVTLPEATRADLHTLIGSGSAPARVTAPARVLLQANQGEAGPGGTDAAIAAAVAVHPTPGARVRKTDVIEGLDAALCRQRAGEPDAQLVALPGGTLRSGQE